MGWTGTHRDRGMTDREFFQREFGDEHIILDCASIGGPGGTFYAAVQTVETGEVWAYIAMKSYDRHDYCNFLYKDMDETSGPYQSECPTRILNLLTDTDDEQARQWRARCRQYALLKTFAHTAHQITVAEPLRFQRIGLVAHFRHIGRRWYDATTGIRLSVSDQVVLSRKVIAAVDSSGADLPVPALS